MVACDNGPAITMGSVATEETANRYTARGRAASLWCLAPYRMLRALRVGSSRSPGVRKSWAFWN